MIPEIALASIVCAAVVKARCEMAAGPTSKVLLSPVPPPPMVLIWLAD